MQLPVSPLTLIPSSISLRNPPPNIVWAGSAALLLADCRSLLSALVFLSCGFHLTATYLTASHLDAARICSSLPLITVTASRTIASHMHEYYSLVRVPQSLALITTILLTASCTALLLSLNCYHTTASCHTVDLSTVHTFVTACATASLTTASHVYDYCSQHEYCITVAILTSVHLMASTSWLPSHRWHHIFLS